MKHLKTFESYVSSLNEGETFDAAGFADMMAKLGQEMAKMDMVLELMTDDPEELEAGRTAAATEIVKQLITAILKEDLPKDKLPRIKTFLSTFKTKFPELAAKDGLEKACQGMVTEMSKVLEFEVISSKADISEDAIVNQLAKAGEDDIEAGVKAIAAHTDKFIKTLFA
jgi:hypothetical protein